MNKESKYNNDSKYMIFPFCHHIINCCKCSKNCRCLHKSCHQISFINCQASKLREFQKNISYLDTKYNLNPCLNIQNQNNINQFNWADLAKTYTRPNSYIDNNRHNKNDNNFINNCQKQINNNNNININNNLCLPRNNSFNNSYINPINNNKFDINKYNTYKTYNLLDKTHCIINESKYNINPYNEKVTTNINQYNIKRVNSKENAFNFNKWRRNKRKDIHRYLGEINRKNYLEEMKKNNEREIKLINMKLKCLSEIVNKRNLDYQNIINTLKKEKKINLSNDNIIEKKERFSFDIDKDETINRALNNYKNNNVYKEIFDIRNNYENNIKYKYKNNNANINNSYIYDEKNNFEKKMKRNNSYNAYRHKYKYKKEKDNAKNVIIKKNIKNNSYYEENDEKVKYFYKNKRNNTFGNINDKKECKNNIKKEEDNIRYFNNNKYRNNKENKKLVNKEKKEEENKYKYQFSDVDIDTNGTIKKHIRYRGDSTIKKSKNNFNDIIIDDYSKPFSKYIYTNRNTINKYNNIFYKEIFHKNKSKDDNDIDKNNIPFEPQKIFLSNIEKEEIRNNKRNFSSDFRRIIYIKDNENISDNNPINIKHINNNDYNFLNKDYSNLYDKNDKNINNKEFIKNNIINDKDKANNYNIRRVEKKNFNEESLPNNIVKTNKDINYSSNSQNNIDYIKNDTNNKKKVENNIYQKDIIIQSYKGKNKIDENLNEVNEKDYKEYFNKNKKKLNKNYNFYYGNDFIMNNDSRYNKDNDIKEKIFKNNKYLDNNYNSEKYNKDKYYNKEKLQRNINDNNNNDFLDRCVEKELNEFYVRVKDSYLIKNQDIENNHNNINKKKKNINLKIESNDYINQKK